MLNCVAQMSLLEFFDLVFGANKKTTGRLHHAEKSGGRFHRKVVFLPCRRCRRRSLPWGRFPPLTVVARPTSDPSTEPVGPYSKSMARNGVLTRPCEKEDHPQVS